MLVTPSVVLLDNHTTNRKGEITESYGWKWENKPPMSDAWLGYYANYLKIDNLDVRLQPFYLVYSGWINQAINDTGYDGNYHTSAQLTDTRIYYLGFDNTNLFPSPDNWRLCGYSIRCLAR